MTMLTQTDHQPGDSVAVAVITSCPQSPASFLTQAQRPTPGRKRKSMAHDDSTTLEELEQQVPKCRRGAETPAIDGRLSVEAGEPATFSAEEEASQSSSESAEVVSAAASEQDHKLDNCGTVFSPHYKALSHHTASTEAAANDEAGADENLQPAHPGVANHHHHPPPPEVPEAAESDYDEDEDEAEFMEFDPLAFIRTLPSLEEVVPRFRKMLLPKQTRQCKRKTLVLDLDETLVHSSLESVVAPDFSFLVHFNNQEHTIHVRQRPHLHEFMARVSELFEIVVFTASQKIYAEKLLNIIDPKHKYIKHRIYRDSCVIVDGNYLKDLSVLGRDLANTLIVDNSPQAFGFQIDNGVPIESWYEDPSDEELSKLLPFLESLVDVEDVRPHIATKFKLRELIARATN